MSDINQFPLNEYDQSLPKTQPWSIQRPFIHDHMILTDLTVEIPESYRVPPNEPERKPQAKWRTLEFMIYIAIACVVIPIMAWIPVSLSSPSNPNYKFFQRRLSSGWIPFRKVDNSDAQYRGFRSNFWILTAVASFYLSVKFFWVRNGRTLPDNLHLVRYNLVWSILFLAGLHGTSIVKIFVILFLNYLVAVSCGGSKVGPVLTWAFNGAVMFANDRFNGYSFGHILPSLEVFDSYPGAYARWHIIYNLTMLRLISFNMDYYWACKTREFAEHRWQRAMTHAERQASHPPQMYTFRNYMSYIVYPPLYIAGPIMTFNDYLWQHRKPIHIDRRTTLLYLIRFLASLLTMELILHFMYVVAIKDTRAWKGNTPAQISLIGFWNLIIVWLKLLIPWRFFRLWAMADCLEVPENMVRCMANNYSTLGFWRSWHRSYNLWLIRYIYVPLGGSKRALVNTALVFTFVALWHDLTFRLLAWGWLVTLFVLPEVLAGYILPKEKYGHRPWYRHVCALGGVVNVLMMMAANLVGFVLGTDGMRIFLGEMFGTRDGLIFLGGACGCLFVGVQLMFEYREEEKRKGIYRRC